MPRKVKFALVFTENPPAVDIFREDEFEGAVAMETGQKRLVKKKSWKHQVEGVILRTGTLL